MATTFSCERCKKLIESASGMNLFNFQNGTPFRFSAVENGEKKKINDIGALLCDECSRDLLGHYFGKEVVKT